MTMRTRQRCGGKFSGRKVLFVALFLIAQTVFHHCLANGDATIIDARHYSTVFGEIRYYRVFLPPGYDDNPEKKYPVVYFLHGWSQRYFGNSGQEYAGFDFDQGADNKGDNIANFVAAHDVIVVKPDGYNRTPAELYYLRPYNVGPVESFRQFPVYLPELVEHIDAEYNTLADRSHRGICGLSMGGFMSYWIAGKYPHLFSAAGNFCGAIEFLAGPKEFPVEYRLLDYHKNYKGLNVRLHYGDKDYIRGYHQDMVRIWRQVMENFDYRVYDGYHATTGLGEMLSFMLNTFEDPPPAPRRWDHIDVYPAFSVWGYEVRSDRMVSGVTILENVDASGFRCSVKAFFPNGALIPDVNVSIITAPLYERNQLYVINDFDTRTSKVSQRTVRSDDSGRLKITINGSAHEIGINKKKDRPNITIASVALVNTPWATHRKEVSVSIKILNKGLAAARNVRAELSAATPTASVIQPRTTFGTVAVNEMRDGDATLTFFVAGDSVEIQKFRLTLKDDNNNAWAEDFEIPLEKESPAISDFVIADGRTFTVASAGVDLETVFLGNGNGDGVANPGESIVLLVRDQNKYWRTDLTFSDPYLNPSGINIRESDNWTEFDHVGASMKYDIPLIASHCPEDHRLVFLATYFHADYPFHIPHRGVIEVAVKGNDTTPPVIDSVRIPGDNVVHVKVYDGSKVKSVTARFILKSDPVKTFEVSLQDDGLDADRVEGDNVFSKKIDPQKFGIYRVVVEATDTFGNKMARELADTYVLH